MDNPYQTPSELTADPTTRGNSGRLALFLVLMLAVLMTVGTVFYYMLSRQALTQAQLNAREKAAAAQKVLETLPRENADVGTAL